MAKLVFAMNQSLDGFVDHTEFRPDPTLFLHFVEEVGTLAGSIYGRRMYEIMRYWDDDRPDWDDAEREYAAAWRRMRKWVVSRSLTRVGPNATLISDDVVATIRSLKEELDGEIGIAGPDLAGSLAEAAVIDEYRIYLHPVALGQGTPYFTGAVPELRLVESERIGDRAIRLRYVPE